ncbi:hypothetical protein H6F50_15965 [Coleofasciculus sp. FACHB-712]|uniref:hypothetical protein n=1 Tax=Cyanophyceae TaxID=3028117 RepID=UPI0016853EE1|nr:MULTISPECIES: hypothetical protein [unclassified Coleofasciculus]MBD1892725.1 hypothetical protein [Coleofasciculus sp. FACHB-SPT9]MBD1900002.1 hypothetical protein [Coleofasciculus sp. FACHB-125]MBD1943835.1 hypothetical protein [Coleofasciculus sp. FACHB-712]
MQVLVPNLLSHVLLQFTAAAGKPRLYRIQQFLKSGHPEAIAILVAIASGLRLRKTTIL